MEATKETKVKPKKQNNIFAKDNDIFIKVLENQSSEYISNIYFEFEKNNSIADIFAVKDKKDFATKLKTKKIVTEKGKVYAVNIAALTKLIGDDIGADDGGCARGGREQAGGRYAQRVPHTTG